MTTENKFKFLPFHNTGRRYGSYTISISRNYAFGFNAGFYHRENIKSYTHVLLGYDATQKAIAFVFSSQPKEGMFKILHNKSSGSIVAHSFFKAYDFNLEECAGRYEPTFYKESERGRSFYIQLGKN